jgi:hypothetical protein
MALGRFCLPPCKIFLYPLSLFYLGRRAGVVLSRLKYCAKLGVQGVTFTRKFKGVRSVGLCFTQTKNERILAMVVLQVSHIS